MIWRRVMVPATMTLHELHGVLQVAMGWKSIHLYAFDIYAVQYGSFELMMGSPRVPLAQFSFRKNNKFYARIRKGPSSGRNGWTVSTGQL